MKIIQKYFLALIPPTEVFAKAEEIKSEIRDQFGIKYALKSPSHITLKMPFSYNESKEGFLIEKIKGFLKEQGRFQVELKGVGTFGRRVIFLDVAKSTALDQLQEKLKIFCRRELHLVEELSDRNFRPHMTISFKDLKESKFDGVLELVKSKCFVAKFPAENLAILKRIEGKWILLQLLPFGEGFSEKR